MEHIVKIGLNKEAMGEKIAQLKEIQSKLESEIKIPALVFGADNLGDSESASQAEMEIVNEEYANAVTSLSKLVKSTVVFLKTISENIIRADENI